jgi:hypothetical protein
LDITAEERRLHRYNNRQTKLTMAVKEQNLGGFMNEYQTPEEKIKNFLSPTFAIT